MGEDTTVKPPVNAHIGTYKNATQRQDVRVLTHLCSCGAIMAIVLNNDEVPDENLCTRCWMYGQLTYEEDDPDALL